MTLQEKQELLFKLFNITDIVPESTRHKIEGIIIGVSLRETMEERIENEKR